MRLSIVSKKLNAKINELNAFDIIRYITSNSTLVKAQPLCLLIGGTGSVPSAEEIERRQTGNRGNAVGILSVCLPLWTTDRNIQTRFNTLGTHTASLTKF